MYYIEWFRVNLLRVSCVWYELDMCVFSWNTLGTVLFSFSSINIEVKYSIS